MAMDPDESAIEALELKLARINIKPHLRKTKSGKIAPVAGHVRVMEAAELAKLGAAGSAEQAKTLKGEIEVWLSKPREQKAVDDAERALAAIEEYVPAYEKFVHSVSKFVDSAGGVEHVAEALPSIQTIASLFGMSRTDE